MNVNKDGTIGFNSENSFLLSSPDIKTLSQEGVKIEKHGIILMGFAII